MSTRSEPSHLGAVHGGRATTDGELISWCVHAVMPQLRIARLLVRTHAPQHATCARNAANNLSCAFSFVQMVRVEGLPALLSSRPNYLLLRGQVCCLLVSVSVSVLS